MKYLKLFENNKEVGNIELDSEAENLELRAEDGSITISNLYDDESGDIKEGYIGISVFPDQTPQQEYITVKISDLRKLFDRFNNGMKSGDFTNSAGEEI